MLRVKVPKKAILLEKNEVGVLSSKIAALPFLSSALPALKLEYKKCSQAGPKNQR
jgi:hypothetical protein